MKEAEKTNETHLEVDLSALGSNLSYYKSKLKEGTRVMVMVKAGSYGFGAVEVPKYLEEKGVDYFGVVFADEGVRLRKAGVQTPLMVMNPGKGSLSRLVDYELEPLLYNEYLVDELIKVLPERMADPLPVHLKLESGMNRLGIHENDLDRILEKLKAEPRVRVTSVLSHLASSSQEKFDPFTEEQIERFRNSAQKVMDELGHPVIRHILNSGGVSRFTEAQFEMVRLGIGLYGVGATDEDRQELRNLATLRTTISQIKDVKKGETVGYDRAFQADRDSRIAIIPIGYADGFSRPLGKGKGKARVCGEMVPVVGNICMDMAFLDVSGKNCHEGDEVILFDDAYPLQEFAKSMNKIPYEAITNISERVKRVFFHS